MKKPPIPKNDHERILQLLSYNILDTASEEEYDQLTELAASLSGSSIALVSLVDTNRQWFNHVSELAGYPKPLETFRFALTQLHLKKISLLLMILLTMIDLGIIP